MLYKLAWNFVEPFILAFIFNKATNVAILVESAYYSKMHTAVGSQTASLKFSLKKGKNRRTMWIHLIVQDRQKGAIL